MTATLTPTPKQQFFDANGNPLVGGKLYSYVAGTTSPLVTYVDSDQVTTNTNPIILDSRGEANVWLAATSYKLKLVSATDVEIWTVDNIAGAGLADQQLVNQITATYAASNGSSLVGYLPAGTGAVATTVQTKLRESVSVNDFGSSFETALPTSLTAIRSTGGALNVTTEVYTPTTRSEIVGNFGDGLLVNGQRATITGTGTAANQDGILVGNVIGNIASQYFNKYKIANFSFVGPGKVGASAGVHQQAAADIQLDNLQIKNWPIGLLLDGGLTSAYTGSTTRSNGIGVQAKVFDDGAGGLNSFSPNANSFYDLRCYENDVAVKYDNNPSGCANWFSCNFEGNNYISGTPTDGVKVLELTNAGHHNFIGCHMESNLGQWGIHYTGADSTKSLLVAGCEMIDAVGTNLYVAQGRLTSIASRITNTTSTNDINIGTGARATLIDTEAQLSGDTSYVLSIRDGRIGFGSQPIASGPLIDAKSAAITAASNIAASWQNDTVQLRWLNTAGTRVGYLQTSASGNHTLNNDNAAGGWVLRAANSDRLYVGRAGALSIEPGGDNSTTCGSAALRWSTVYAGTGTINTSDERQKQDIADLDAAEKRVATSLKTLVKKFRFKDAVQVKGDGARIHVGVIAQEVIAAFQAESLDPMQYAIVCYDEWEDQYSPVFEDNGEPTNEVAVVQAAGNRYGIRYEELLAFIISAL